tara:strand:- start:111 stop:284 length:174 start_codon:yes stop_codon:yes gene_type:complete
MEEKYSIKDILNAVNDLNNREKKTINVINNKTKKLPLDNSDIPINTLKLIEEAEGNN